MDRHILYQNLMEAINQKIPRDKNLVNFLMEILQLEKEAVYRRINGKVPFSFLEIATISDKLDFSLDDIVSPDYSKSRPSRFLITEFIDPTANYYTVLEEIVNLLKSTEGKIGTEGCEVTNSLPQPLYLMYENISRYFLFKWKIHNGYTSNITPYNQISIPEELRELQLENIKVSQYLSKSNYIFDNLLFYHIIHEIKLYMSMDLISPEESQLIKTDLHYIVDEIEILARRGAYPDSGNSLNIYVSNINIPTSYCYIQTDDEQISLVKAFSINGVTSTDRRIFEKMKGWIDSIKRQSTLISQTGERERTLFIDEQRKIIESL